MIPSIISDASIIFVARGQPWTLATDHPRYAEIRRLLLNGETDEDKLIRLADVRVAVEEVTEGRAQLTEEGLFLDGEALPEKWHQKAINDPDATRALLINPGDRVRVEGDADAPDGIYTVGEIDNDDVNKRVYVESEDDYFGFVANGSIKEIIHD
jgi:hypothetical protein